YGESCTVSRDRWARSPPDRGGRSPASRKGRGTDPHPCIGTEPRRGYVSQGPVYGRAQASRPTGVRGGGNRGRDWAGCPGLPNRRRGQHYPKLLAESLRSLRRSCECPGPCRDSSSRFALLGRGSVGLAAIQIANKVGATPIALTRGQSKRKALLDAGAAHVITTDEQDLVKEILGITGGKGARVVFDPVGGPTFAKLAGATAHLGTLFLYGALSTQPTPLPLFDVLGKWLTVRGYVMMEITGDPERLEKAKKFINEGLADGSFRPIIARSFP